MLFKKLMIRLTMICGSILLVIPIEILIIKLFKLGQMMSVILSIILEIITIHKVVKISRNNTSTDK